ncbi:uncharacterized protein DS421_13g422760 [Arachis hypogaea]|nr:uncharacterized protein DS421_13g422760 [Arachis hypogaea]
MKKFVKSWLPTSGSPPTINLGNTAAEIDKRSTPETAARARRPGRSLESRSSPITPPSPSPS